MRTATILTTTLLLATSTFGQPPATRLKALIDNAANANSAAAKKALGSQALDIAKAAPKDATALQAVAWIYDSGLDLEPAQADEAVKLVLDHHTAGDATMLQFLCGCWETAKGVIHETGLRGILARSKSRDVQGYAAYLLASRLKAQADVGGDAKDAVALYERVARDFADLKGDPTTSLDVYAKRGLFELNNLMVGKLAPEPPAGTVDLAGKPARLSDYRGKVVLLDFWLVNCPPCRKLIPHSRALVTKYAGKPFAFVAVNGDHDRGEAEAFLQTQSLPGVQWWGGPSGGMARAWNMSPFPTMMVLDAKGVVRAKFRGEFKPEEVEAAVAKLVHEAEAAKTN